MLTHQQGFPVDVKAEIYPPFFEDMDEKESIQDKQDLCIHIL